MHMLGYMQALVKVVVKNPLLWALILVCQLLLVAPFIKGDATMGYFLGKEELDVALRESRKSMEEGVYDSAPSEVRERAQERIDLMTRACMTDDPTEYARLRAQLLKGDIVDFKAGNLIGPTEKSLEAKYRFFTQLSEQNDARIYKTYREAPALFYFAAAYSSLPLLMWALPSIASVALLNCVVRGKRLLAQAPLGRLTALASQVNVLGQSEVAVIESSVGQIVPRALAMLVLAALFATLLAYAVSRLMPQRDMSLGPIAAAALLAMPMVEAYIHMGSLFLDEGSGVLAPDPLAPFSPLAYLDDFMNVAGRANYWPNQALLADERLTLGMAAIVFLGWAFAALALAFGATCLRGRALARKDATHHAPSGKSMAAQRVSLAYGKHPVLEDASCEQTPGSITGLIAPNGAGKTTFLEALVALGPTRRAGSVHANGVASSQAAFRKLVLYVPCDAGLLYPNLTAADHIKLAAALWPDKVDTAKLIELCGLAGYLNKPVRAYSAGMKQQLALAVAYCTGARYLLLDEPMNALDPGNVALNSYIMKRLAAQGTSVLLSSHILFNLDELCDSLLVIRGGSLARVTPDRACGGARSVYERAFGALRTFGEPIEEDGGA